MQTKKLIILASAGFNAVGGMETYMANLVAALDKKGWDVHCLATTSASDNKESLGLVAHFHDLSSMPLSPSKIFKVASLINEINPDVLLMNHCPLVQYALPMLHESIKPISVLHSDDPRFYRIAVIFRDRIFRWIAPTRGVADNFAAFAGTKNLDRVNVIPHGIDTAIFNPESRSSQASNKIAFVGYIAENKGVDLLPQIIHQVSQKCPDVHLDVVGYGPLRETLESQFCEYGLEKNLTIHGALKPTEVADVLRNSDVFLLPTRIEGFGLAVVEAMLCGSVPVVTNISGITDQLFENGQSGFLAERDDVAGFAGAILTIISTPEYCQVLSLCTSQDGLNRFSRGRMIADYEQIFAEPDNRLKRAQRTRAGWCIELSSEVMRDRGLGDLIKKARYLLQ